MDTITVVTLTRQRHELLRRAIASVRSQDYLGCIDHLAVIDDCPATARDLANIESSSRRRLIPHFAARALGEIPDGRTGRDVVYPRISRLLNIGVHMAQSRWIAFLDDDNEYEANHLSSLMECAVRNDCSAVHSFRAIYHADGSPYLEPRFPWASDLEEGVRIYEVLCSRGVWVRNSHVLKDRAGPYGLTPFRNSTILSSRDPVFLVDTSVWLLERSLLMKYPFRETFSEKDRRDNTAPDDMLLQSLLEGGVRVVATGLPTLRYYLGGISN
jgi:glycosyltransferase involved in cell wall biosynthesis